MTFGHTAKSRPLFTIFDLDSSCLHTYLYTNLRKTNCVGDGVCWIYLVLWLESLSVRSGIN